MLGRAIHVSIQHPTHSSLIGQRRQSRYSIKDSNLCHLLAITDILLSSTFAKPKPLPFLTSPHLLRLSQTKNRANRCSSFGSSAIFFLKRPAAFRPLLTKGLALSGTLFHKMNIMQSPRCQTKIRPIKLSFRDYPLKSAPSRQTLSLKTSGTRPRKGGCNFKV